MHQMVSRLWNLFIDLLGLILGHILRISTKHYWVHFPFASEALSIIPFSFGWKLRRAIYAQVLKRIGEEVVLHFGVILDDPRTSIGNDVWVSVGCYIDYVEIGNSVLIGPKTVILSGGRHHNFDRLDIPIKQQGNPPKQPIVIGDGVWVGANATIMANVGHDAIVGAGAVVTKFVPPYAVVAGNQARIIRMRNRSNHSDLSEVEDPQQDGLPLILKSQMASKPNG